MIAYSFSLLIVLKILRFLDYLGFTSNFKFSLNKRPWNTSILRSKCDVVIWSLFMIFENLFSTCCVFKMWKIIIIIIVVFMSQVSYSKLIYKSNGAMRYSINTIIIFCNLLFKRQELHTSCSFHFSNLFCLS